MARVRFNKKGLIVLTISVHEAQMAGDALAESMAKHGLDKDGTTGKVLAAIDRALARQRKRSVTTEGEVEG